jgi:hypothetical protein
MERNCGICGIAVREDAYVIDPYVCAWCTDYGHDVNPDNMLRAWI